MNRFRLLLLAFMMLAGCSDIQSVQTGELSVRPEMVRFRSLMDNETTVIAQVELQNIGRGRLPIAGVRIEEDDSRTELFLVDQDDLQSERYIEPNGRELILLEWTPVTQTPTAAFGDY